MIDNGPLLSIVMPTHNRSQYAFHAIRSVLQIDGNIELVVTDTSSDRLLEGLLGASSFFDQRLRYYPIREPSNITENYNAGVSRAKGEFILLIGDDDTITPTALDIAAWAKANRIDAVSQTISANYAWPDFVARFVGSGHASRLYFERRAPFIKRYRSSDAVRNGLANAGQGSDGMPRCYHGIIRRTVLESFKATAGSYFFGSSPDVSGAFAVAISTEDYWETNFPFSIPGASANSNTGRSATNKHKGDLEGEAQTAAYTNSGWSEGVPRFFAVETVWAHAAIETLLRIAPQLLKEFNFARLLGRCMYAHPDYRTAIEEAIPGAANILGIDRSRLWQDALHERNRARYQRLAHLARRMMRPTAAGGRPHIDDLSDILEAQLALSNVLENSRADFLELLKKTHA